LKEQKTSKEFEMSQVVKSAPTREQKRETRPKKKDLVLLYRSGDNFTGPFSDRRTSPYERRKKKTRHPGKREGILHLEETSHDPFFWSRKGILRL